MARTANLVQLSSETARAFDTYTGEAEAEMDRAMRGASPFLWSDTNSVLSRQIRAGEIPAQFWSGHSPVKVQSGLIHDWIAAVFVRGVSLKETLALVQDYDRHKLVYQPEVIDSSLVSRNGNHFKIFLRLLKKKVVTVVLDTHHDVRYISLKDRRCFCRSHTTRVEEVEGAGTCDEEVLPYDTGHGFLWRLYSYWKFQEKKNGTVVECRAISLTRDVPFGLGWLIEPIIQNLPKESLIHTLAATRRGLQA
jgi:hypothetical protein